MLVEKRRETWYSLFVGQLPQKEVAPMWQFLANFVANIVANVVAGLILRKLK